MEWDGGGNMFAISGGCCHAPTIVRVLKLQEKI